MPETCLVTGGAGFIGSNIAEGLVRRGDRVRVLDNFSTGRPENLAGLDVDVVEGALRDLAQVQRAVAGVTGVFHEAALRSVPRSVDDPVSTNDVNVGGTLNLLMAPEWLAVWRVLLEAQSAYPVARTFVAGRLAALESGHKTSARTPTVAGSRSGRGGGTPGGAAGEHRYCGDGGLDRPYAGADPVPAPGDPAH